MVDTLITSPSEYVAEVNTNKPVFNGQMYIGEPDLDPEIPANQKQVSILNENGTTTPISQPIAISAGGVFVDDNGDFVRLVVDGNHSQKILDRLGSQVYYIPNVFFGEPITPTSGNAVLAADTVDEMKTLDLQSGQFIRTKGYYSEGDGGSALYLIQTAAEFGGTPDEFGDHTLDNGNIAVLDITGVVYASQYGARSIASFDSQPMVQALIDRAYEEQLVVESEGKIEIDSPLVFKAPDDVNYWDDTSELRPPSFVFDSIKCNSEDVALDLIGEVVGANVEINNLIGPGVTTIQPVGSGLERVGIRFSHNQNTVKVNSISDFNINILLDGAFNTVIDIGSCFAAIYGVHSRVGSVNTFNNQNNQITYGFIGGPFTSNAFPDDALRRSRGCKYGIFMEQGTAFHWIGGALKYIQRDDDSIAIRLDSGAHNNSFFCYLEGSRNEGSYISCDGDDNDFFLAEMRGTTTAKVAANITGVGNRIKKLPFRVSESSEGATTSEATAGAFNVSPGNSFDGNNSIVESQVASVLKHNLLHNATTATAGNGSAATNSDFPQESDGDDSIQITVNDDGSFFYDFTGISIAGESLRTVQVHTWLRGVTNHAKIAFYVLDDVDRSIVLNRPISTGVEPSTDWQKVSSVSRIDTPPSGSITFRMVVRNTVDGETGCIVRIYPPVLTFNIDTTNRNLSNDTLDNTDVIKGKIIPEEVMSLRANSSKVNSVSDLAGNVLPTSGRGLVNITANPSAGNISSIVNMRDDTTVMIINSHSAAITVTTAAGEWVSNFSFNPGEAISITQVNGLKYLQRS